MTDEPAGDVEVLGPDPEPGPASRPPGTWNWRPLFVVLAVAFIATIAWLNRPKPADPPIIADDPMDQGSRPRPLYPGADGRLLFTIPDGDGERLWIVHAGTGAVDPGPVLPAMPSIEGFPPQPGTPPDRRFALGPGDTPGAAQVAFLGRSEFGGGRTFAYALDVSDSQIRAPEPAGVASALAWGPTGELLTVHQAPDGLTHVESVQAGGVVEIARWIGFAADIAVTGDRYYLLERELFAGDRPVAASHAIWTIEGPEARRLLRGWHVLGWGRNGQFLVEDPFTESAGPVHLWRRGEAPSALSGFEPERILAWTDDRQRYAAVGGFRGEYGLWLVSFPNTPIFLMTPLDLEQGDTLDGVAFAGEATAAFFVKNLELWLVEIGSERARRVSLPPEAARGAPSGPLVWVP